MCTDMKGCLYTALFEAAVWCAGSHDLKREFFHLIRHRRKSELAFWINRWALFRGVSSFDYILFISRPLI